MTPYLITLDIAKWKLISNCRSNFTCKRKVCSANSRFYLKFNQNLTAKTNSYIYKTWYTKSDFEDRLQIESMISPAHRPEVLSSVCIFAQKTFSDREMISLWVVDISVLWEFRFWCSWKHLHILIKKTPSEDIFNMQCAIQARLLFRSYSLGHTTKRLVYQKE